jgi:hypothetical protein
MKNFIAALFSLFFLHGLIAQSDRLFDDSRLSSVHITIPADSLQLLYDSVLSDHYYLVEFVFDDGEARDTLRNVGFRLRGNTSRYSKKKSFKISFNTYVPGRKYQGVKKINLNGEHNDPTMIREKLFYELWRKTGMPERRTTFVRVYINDIYYGLYTNLEEMDKDWLGRVFPDKMGNLYKCTYPADLVYHGPGQQVYKDLENSTATGGRVYELQTNEEEDDYSGLVELITRLNQFPDTVFQRRIAEVLNVRTFLKALALDAATGNWDDYGYNKNNYYLYDHPATGLFELITYDPDNSFGIDWFGIDWGRRDCRTWVNSGLNLPLAQKLLKITPFNEDYKAFLDTISRTIIHPDTVFPRIDALKALIQTAAEADIYRTLDYGYSINDFNQSFNQSIDDHTPYGLKPFFAVRSASIQQQLHPAGTGSISGETPSFFTVPNPASDKFIVVIHEKIHDPVQIWIMDHLGRIVFVSEWKPVFYETFRIGFLTPGIYRLCLEFRDGSTGVRSFVKL